MEGQLASSAMPTRCSDIRGVGESSETSGADLLQCIANGLAADKYAEYECGRLRCKQ